MKFIDLFCGLGGFHIALQNLGWRCVFASELQDDLRDLYETNFGLRPAGDITAVNPSDIPDHDILCAGFPCQPFSSAGQQNGFEDARGTLVWNIREILRAKRPPYFILENVPMLMTLQKGWIFQTILGELRGLGYHVQHTVLSPDMFGIPHYRPRVFIAGSLDRPPALPPAKLPSTAPPVDAFIEAKPAVVAPVTDLIRRITDDFEILIDRYGPQRLIDCNDYGCPAALRLQALAPFWHQIDIMRPQEGVSFRNRIIDVRVSRMRVYRPNIMPCIVSTGHGPFITWQRRNPTRLEYARLMGLESLPNWLPGEYARSPWRRAVGNAVVPACVQAVAETLCTAS